MIRFIRMTCAIAAVSLMILIVHNAEENWWKNNSWRRNNRDIFNVSAAVPSSNAKKVNTEQMQNIRLNMPPGSIVELERKAETKRQILGTCQLAFESCINWFMSNYKDDDWDIEVDGMGQYRFLRGTRDGFGVVINFFESELKSEIETCDFSIILHDTNIN